MIGFGRKNRSSNRRKEARGGFRLSALPWRRMLPVAMLFVTGSAVVFVVRECLDLPVQRVAIRGLQRVAAPDVEKAVRSAVAGHGLVSVDLARVAGAVEMIPWVDKVSIARNWPHTLSVQVVEQVPVARWGSAGLLNRRGEVFDRDVRHFPAELPQFDGPEGFAADMTARYLEIAPRLVDVGMRVVRMRLDERGAWEIALDNGVALRLGRMSFDERFERFLGAALKLVSSRAPEISYVDLRYSAGFAIGWRSAKDEVKSG